MGHSEDIREERRGRRIYSTLMLKGIVSVGRILATNARDIKRLRTMQTSEARYARPPRRYTLPPYEPGMRISQSATRYLRPTRYCNSRAPEVVALAHSLGAYQVSDRAFAQAAFAFAKDKMTLEIAPIDGVTESLQRGTGTCFELISVFIALCRAAGIQARYKIFPSNMIQAWREATIDADPLLQQWYDALGYFLLEGEGEAFIDGQWVVAHVGPTAERQAAAGIPISRLGEDAIGSWFHVRPETMMRLEALPFGLAEGSWLLHKISPGSMERVNVSVLQEIARGRQIIAEAGGVDAYDAQARRVNVNAAEPSEPSGKLSGTFKSEGLAA
jgi:hypothetical protein